MLEMGTHDVDTLLAGGMCVASRNVYEWNMQAPAPLGRVVWLLRRILYQSATAA